MTDTTPTIAKGDEYIIFYSGGPYDGTNDTRISTDGSWDSELTVVVDIDDVGTQQVYKAIKAITVGDKLQVTYAWDSPDSDGLTAPEERAEL